MLKTLLDILFPPACPFCEEDLASAEGLCPRCKEGFLARKLNGPFCIVCGEPFASGSGGAHTCGTCIAEKIPFIEARSACMYEGCVLDAVHSLKYAGKTNLARALGAITAKAALSLSAKPDIIVPVPLHKKKLRARGFNQSLLISRGVAKALSVKIDYTSLKRIRHTGQQVGLKADERKKNVAGAFELKGPEKFKGKRVLLIDDVYTTGATIKECSKVLRKAGAEVYALTLARAAKV